MQSSSLLERLLECRRDLATAAGLGSEMAPGDGGGKGAAGGIAPCRAALDQGGSPRRDLSPPLAVGENPTDAVLILQSHRPSREVSTSPSRNSSNFSPKLPPACLAQQLEPFVLPCPVPQHPHGHRRARISPDPSLSAQRAWEYQNGDVELKSIFLGTPTASRGPGAAWDGLLAVPSVRNEPLSEIYSTVYSCPSSSHHLGFPRSFFLTPAGENST